MAGSNLTYTNSPRLRKLIGNLLVQNQSLPKALTGKVCRKAGVPTTNAANDQPNEVGDICYDSTNSAAYVSVLNTDSTHHTWNKVTP